METLRKEFVEVIRNNLNISFINTLIANYMEDNVIHPSTYGGTPIRDLVKIAKLTNVGHEYYLIDGVGVIKIGLKKVRLVKISDKGKLCLKSNGKYRWIAYRNLVAFVFSGISNFDKILYYINNASVMYNEGLYLLHREYDGLPTSKTSYIADVYEYIYYTYIDTPRAIQNTISIIDDTYTVEEAVSDGYVVVKKVLTINGKIPKYDYYVTSNCYFINLYTGKVTLGNTSFNNRIQYHHIKNGRTTPNNISVLRIVYETFYNTKLDNRDVVYSNTETPMLKSLYRTTTGELTKKYHTTVNHFDKYLSTYSKEKALPIVVDNKLYPTINEATNVLHSMLDSDIPLYNVRYYLRTKRKGLKCKTFDIPVDKDVALMSKEEISNRIDILGKLNGNYNDTIEYYKKHI